MHRKKNNYSNDDVCLHSSSCFTYNVSNTSIANMSKGGNFFNLMYCNFPHCAPYQTATSVILIWGSAGGIRNRRRKPLTTTSCLLFHYHPTHSPCSNKQIKWGKLIPLEPLWALHVTHCRAPQLPTWACVSGSVNCITWSNVCLRSGPRAGTVCQEEERKCAGTWEYSKNE